MVTLFLSYSLEDKDFVEELYRRFKRDGVKCFYDKTSIISNSNCVLELKKGIEECEYIVFVLTPEFCNSKWKEIECTDAYVDSSEKVKEKLIILLEKPCNLPSSLQANKTIDVSTIEKFEENYPIICQTLGITPGMDALPTDRTKLPPITSLPPVYRMPYRSLDNGFVGRVQELWEVYDLLCYGKTKVVVITGIDGVGKTRVAIEYVHRFAGQYPGGVFWIDSCHGITIMIELVAHVAGIEIDGKLPEKEQLSQLWNKLNRTKTTLLVLDNFLEDEPLAQWLPACGNIHTLVTTRQQDLGGHTCFSLNVLRAKDGVELINTGIRKEGKEAEALVEALGGLPIALKLAKQFLNLQPQMVIGKLHEEMRKFDEKKSQRSILGKNGTELSSEQTKNIAAILQFCWKSLSPTAQLILKFISLLIPTPVPRFLIQTILKLEHDYLMKSFIHKLINLYAKDSKSDPFDEAIDQLVIKFSLIELDVENAPIAHRLICEFVRTKIDDINELYKNISEAVLIELSRVKNTRDIHAYQEIGKILPYAKQLLSVEFINAANAGAIANLLCFYYRQIGKLHIAKIYSRKSLEISESKYPPGHKVIMMSQNELGLVLHNIGELIEARDLLRNSLKAAIKNVIPGHPDIAIIQSNLAGVLMDLGELEEARDLWIQAIANKYIHLYLNVSDILSSLTKVLKDLGEYERAANLLNEALTQNRIAILNIEKVKSDLAWVLHDLGDLEKARELSSEVLDLGVKKFEPGQLEIGIRQSNFALKLRDLGHLKEARQLWREVLVTVTKNLAPGHTIIARTQSHLAMVLKDFGELKEAKELLEKSLEFDQINYKAGHPEIARNQSNLAMVLRDLGEFSEAKDLLTKALEAYKKYYKSDHPNIARIKSQLALVLRDLRELDAARGLVKDALESFKQKFKPGHFEIARTQSYLAIVLMDLGKLEEAEDLLRTALKSDEKNFEPDHPDIAKKKLDLAIVLQKAGKLEEAKNLARDALDKFFEKFGSGHWLTKTAKKNLLDIQTELNEVSRKD